MSDVDRGRINLSDEDRLPWLEAVEDEDDDDGVPAARLIALVIVALAAIGLVVGGIFWLRQGLRPKGDGTVIAAPAGSYKVPVNPGEGKGMAVEGIGDASYAASQGANVGTTIDTTSTPERPVTDGVTSTDATGAVPAGAVGHARLPASTAAQAPASAPAAHAPAAAPPWAPASARLRAPVPAATPAKAPPVETARAAAPPKLAEHPAPRPSDAVKAPAAKPAQDHAEAAGGRPASKQIGAYSSQAKAEAGRTDLTTRFPALRGLDLSVEEGTSNGKTVFRIFMRGGKPKVDAVCAALHSAKEGCIPG